MEPLGIVLGVLIIINIPLNLINKNWTASLAWIVTLLEWTRRLDSLIIN